MARGKLLRDRRVIVSDTGCWTLETGDQYADRVAQRRYVYQSFYGALPRGMGIVSLCQVEGCINPLHMKAVERTLGIYWSKHYSLPFIEARYAERGMESPFGRDIVAVIPARLPAVLDAAGGVIRRSPVIDGWTRLAIAIYGTSRQSVTVNGW